MVFHNPMMEDWFLCFPENEIKYAQTYKQVAEEEGREGRHNAGGSVYTQKHSIKMHVVYGMWQKRLSCLMVLGLILYSGTLHL